MARVNHKLVKARLNESRSKITDRQFFTSRLLAGHFEDLAMVQSKRYRYSRRVRVRIIWDPESGFTAATDNDLIVINAGHPFVTKCTGRQERYQGVCGFFAHELGHILYTDFLGGQSWSIALGTGRWYPAAPHLSERGDFDNESDLLEYIKVDPAQRDAVRQISKELANIIEDGYIENRMLLSFPGTLGYGLAQMRKSHFEAIPTVTQLKEKEDEGAWHIFESIMQMILCYIKFGEIKYGDEPYSDERIQIIFGLLGTLDSALQASSPKTRFDVVNRVFIRCWQYAKDYCEKLKGQCSNSGGGDDDGDIGELIKSNFGKLIGTSEEGKGNCAPAPEAEGAIKVVTSSKRTATAKAAQRAEEDAEGTQKAGAKGAEPEETKGNSAEGSTTETVKADSAGRVDAGEPAVDPTCAAEIGKGEEPPATSEGSAVPCTLSASEAEEAEDDSGSNRESPRFRGPDRISDPEGGTVEYNSDYEAGGVDNSANEIEELLDKMAELDACREVENDRLRELNEVAQNISYGNIHAGISVRVNRISEVGPELVEQYDQVAPSLLSISKQLQRSLRHALSDSRRGGKHTGLMLGRKLDARSLHRDDGHVFYKNDLPQESAQLAVGLLLDESGSMGGDRAVYARASAIILYDFCHALGIPVMIYGHTTFGSDRTRGMSLYSYAEFDDIDGKDKYRLMDIRARSCNRDGAALRYVAERLSKRPEEIKLLIVVSDGQPNAAGYSGSPAEEDMRGIKREYQKKGILFVAAAIGEDKANIERIYGDSFMDITDLKQLPVKLVSVVKKHIRV